MERKWRYLPRLEPMEPFTQARFTAWFLPYRGLVIWPSLPGRSSGPGLLTLGAGPAHRRPPQADQLSGIRPTLAVGRRRATRIKTRATTSQSIALATFTSPAPAIRRAIRI